MKLAGAAALAVVLGLGAAGAGAQSGVVEGDAGDSTRVDAACPAGESCVSYEGALFAVDPADGPVLLLVSTVSTITTETVLERKTACTFRGGVVAWPGGRPEVVAEVQEPCAGRFDGAQPGDVYPLAENPLAASSEDGGDDAEG